MSSEQQLHRGAVDLWHWEVAGNNRTISPMDVVDSQLMAHVDHGWKIIRKGTDQTPSWPSGQLDPEDLADGSWLGHPRGQVFNPRRHPRPLRGLEPSKKESLHEMSLQRLMLPIRAHNALWRRGYKNVGSS